MVACGWLSGCSDQTANRQTELQAADNINASMDAERDEERLDDSSSSIVPPASVIEYTGNPAINMKPDKPVVIDFNATWCGPCRQFAPIFYKVASKYVGKAEFFSVDVDKFPELAREFNASAIPTVVVIRPGGGVKSNTGLMSESEFDSFVKSAL